MGVSVTLMARFCSSLEAISLSKDICSPFRTRSNRSLSAPVEAARRPIHPSSPSPKISLAEALMSTL